MTVSAWEHTAIGAMGGSMEVVLMQPMMAIKNALQEGRPVPTSLRHLYRGLPVRAREEGAGAGTWAHVFGSTHRAPATRAQINVLSMAPITASQFGTNRLVQQLMLGKAEGLTGIQTFGSAAISGGVSALIASPSELIIIQQQARRAWGVALGWPWGGPAASCRFFLLTWPYTC
jgi:solute carrier family 25 citrate transporter 1